MLRSKSSAPARAGQVAPKDIVVNTGPTSFVPGPIIGELGAAGLKTSVEGGKIVIKEDKIVANKGEVITSKVADLLNKFKIEPMEVGLKILALYENGVVYGGDVLNIEDSVYIDNVKKAYNEAFSLAIESGYIVKETVEHLIKKAELEAKAIAKETKVFASESVGDVIKEKTICSGSSSGCDGSSVNFDDVGVATWSGSLVTGEPAPNQDNFVALKKLITNTADSISR